MKLLSKLLSPLLFLPLLFACSAGGDPVPEFTGLLYVLDRANKEIYVYDNIGTIDGAVDPVRTISGDNTLLVSPTTLAVDGRRDVLYVAETSEQQVLAFPQSSIANGDVTPLRLYPGLGRGTAMFVDVPGNRLYAGDAVNQAIQAWDNVSSLASGTIPNRTIPLGYEPSAVFVDTDRDLLYVGDPAGGAINVYSNASTLGVLATPDNVIQDTDEPFLSIRSIAGNITNDILFVSDDFVPSIEIFDQASTIDGSVVADRSLQGDTTGLTFDIGQILFVENVLYVQLSRTQVGIYNDANSVDGNTAPTRTLTINPASLINGIAVDLAH
jgi:hypothetical protein